MKNVNKKLLVVTIVALILALSCVVGTFAYLTRVTDPVVNTFVSGDIKLSLEESDSDGDSDNMNNSYAMIPGQTITKDPVVTVGEGSEDCYVYVKIEESADFDKTNVFAYAVADGWTLLEGTTNIYSREYTGGAEVDYAVIKDNKITISEDASSTDMENANDATLTITAYAVQKAAGANAKAAWDAAAFGA